MAADVQFGSNAPPAFGQYRACERIQPGIGARWIDGRDRVEAFRVVLGFVLLLERGGCDHSVGFASRPPSFAGQRALVDRVAAGRVFISRHRRVFGTHQPGDQFGGVDLPAAEVSFAEVPSDQLQAMLGITSVSVVKHPSALSLNDTALAEQPQNSMKETIT